MKRTKQKEACPSSTATAISGDKMLVDTPFIRFIAYWVTHWPKVTCVIVVADIEMFWVSKYKARDWHLSRRQVLRQPATVSTTYNKRCRRISYIVHVCMVHHTQRKINRTVTTLAVAPRGAARRGRLNARLVNQLKCWWFSTLLMPLRLLLLLQDATRRLALSRGFWSWRAESADTFSGGAMQGNCR